MAFGSAPAAYMLEQGSMGSTSAMAMEPSPSDPLVQRRICEAAERARAEAETRRAGAAQQGLAPEIDGRKGPEPVRYGDWESKGLATDF